MAQSGALVQTYWSCPSVADVLPQADDYLPSLHSSYTRTVLESRRWIVIRVTAWSLGLLQDEDLSFSKAIPVP